MLTAAVSVISILMCFCSLSTAQLDLKTCGDEDSVVTCPFFFSKVNDAFRQQNVLYTLRKAFFPTDGNPPVIFGVEMTLDIQNSIYCIFCTSWTLRTAVSVRRERVSPDASRSSLA